MKVELTLKRTHFFQNVEVKEKNALLGEVYEENCLVNTYFSPGGEDLEYQGNLLVENNFEWLHECFLDEVDEG